MKILVACEESQAVTKELRIFRHAFLRRFVRLTNWLIRVNKK